MGISGSVIMNKANGMIGGNLRHSSIINTNKYNPYLNQVNNASSQNSSQAASPYVQKGGEEDKL